MANKIHLTPDKRARLAEFLGALPDATAIRLFSALEHDRAKGGKGLPHDDLIADLRRQLAAHGAAFPARPVTAQRLFFTPFEDFFIVRKSARKRRARIARASIAPIWELLMSEPLAAGAARAAAALEAAIAGGAVPPALEAGLFSAAGEGIARILLRAEDEPRYLASLERQLGGPAGLDDLVEIRMLIEAAPHLKAVRAAFPKPVAALTEEQLFEVRTHYSNARAEAPRTAAYVLLLLMARMSAPWRALAAYYHLAAARDDALGPAASEAAALLHSVFEELEDAARALTRECEGEIDAEAARLAVVHVADLADGIAAEARKARDAAALNRIEASRDVAADALLRLAEQGLVALRRAMPTRNAGGSLKLAPPRPDFARRLAPPAVAAAREGASFLAGAEEAALLLSRPGVTAPIIAEAQEEARRYLSDLVAEIRAAEGEDRSAARRLMEQALEFAAPLIPAADLDLLRQRALVAALTM